MNICITYTCLLSTWYRWTHTLFPLSAPILVSSSFFYSFNDLLSWFSLIMSTLFSLDSQSNNEETTADFRSTAIRFSSKQTIFQHTCNRLSHAYRLQHRPLKSNQLSGQQNGWYSCFSAHRNTIFPPIISKLVESWKTSNQSWSSSLLNNVNRNSAKNVN